MSRALLEYTAFGKTKMLPVRVYVNAVFVDCLPEFDETLWIERGEDWYCFGSPILRDKRVRVVTRDDWMAAKAKGGGA